MNAELASLKSFKVYDAIPRSHAPQGKGVITGRWVVTPKGDKIKCRMVARELNDGTLADVFAHTPSSTALRIILCIALAKGYAMATGDLTTAFLHAPLEHGSEVYFQPPAPVHEAGTLWKLRRALYGLRRSPQVFQRWVEGQLADLLKFPRRVTMMRSARFAMCLSSFGCSFAPMQVR